MNRGTRGPKAVKQFKSDPRNHFKIRRPGTGARPFLLEIAQEIIDLVAVLNAVRVALPTSKLQDF
jgi:hypothetical protein